jgi:hypothetical protein
MKDCPVSLFLQCRKVSNVRRSQGTLRGTPMLAGDAYRVPRRDRQQAHKPLVHAWVGENRAVTAAATDLCTLHPTQPAMAAPKVRSVAEASRTACDADESSVRSTAQRSPVPC